MPDHRNTSGREPTAPHWPVAQGQVGLISVPDQVLPAPSGRIRAGQAPERSRRGHLQVRRDRHRFTPCQTPCGGRRRRQAARHSGGRGRAATKTIATAPHPPAAPCNIRARPRAYILPTPPQIARPPGTERWPSGRRRTPGKCVGGEPSRGFESLSLRHIQFLNPTIGPHRGLFSFCFKGRWPGHPPFGNWALDAEWVSEWPASLFERPSTVTGRHEIY